MTQNEIRNEYDNRLDKDQIISRPAFPVTPDEPLVRRREIETWIQSLETRLDHVVGMLQNITGLIQGLNRKCSDEPIK